MNRPPITLRPAVRGAVLVVTLLMLIAVMLIGIVASQIALQGEKTARNDRDRHFAFQDAEAALLDAEMDIEASPHAGLSRSHLFSAQGVAGFSASAATCGQGGQNAYLGICVAAVDTDKPVWEQVDFIDTSAAAASVPYGHFTGQALATGGRAQSARVPRYVIEMLPDHKAGESADTVRYLYRITAVGFGARETTQVALQTVYRKGGL